MRYYDIKIYPKGSTSSATPIREYTSYPMGPFGNQNDPGALNVVIDAYVYSFAAPQQQAIVQIWGVPITELAQANNYTNCTIQVFAGFKAGLPLNNPAQSGPILYGIIRQSFGNWTGTEMTLDFVVTVAGALSGQDTNVSFSWLAGTSLSSALTTTFNTAFPGVKSTININPKLILGHDEHGVYQALPAFAQTLKRLTAAVIGGNYNGVDITWTPQGINVFDGTNSTVTPIQIAFQDLIGQPVWIGPNTIQFVCPMRADISVGTLVQMPQNAPGSTANSMGVGFVTTTSASEPQARQQSIFNGMFTIVLVHHMGIFRQPDGNAWVTVFNANLQTQIIPPGAIATQSLSFSQ